MGSKTRSWRKSMISRSLRPSAFMNAHSKSFEEAVDIGGGADGACREVAVDALDEAREDAAGAQFDDLLDLVCGKEFDGLAPAHHVRHLFDEELADFVGVARLLRGDIRDKRHGGARE